MLGVRCSEFQPLISVNDVPAATSAAREVQSDSFRRFIALCQYVKKQLGAENIEAAVETAAAVASQQAGHPAEVSQSKDNPSKRARASKGSTAFAENSQRWFSSANCYKLSVWLAAEAVILDSDSDLCECFQPQDEQAAIAAIQETADRAREKAVAEAMLTLGASTAAPPPAPLPATAPYATSSSFTLNTHLIMSPDLPRTKTRHLHPKQPCNCILILLRWPGHVVWFCRVSFVAITVGRREIPSFPLLVCSSPLNALLLT